MTLAMTAESVRKLKAKQSVRIEKFYTLGRKIGAGGFAEVQEGTDIRTGKVYDRVLVNSIRWPPTNRALCRYAVKVLSKLVYAAEKDREHMRTEVELMAKLVGHPNVVWAVVVQLFSPLGGSQPRCR